MQYYDVMVGFNDGLVEVCIQLCFIGWVVFWMGGFYFFKYCVDDFEVGIRCKGCCMFCSQFFYVLLKCDVVKNCFIVVCEK